MNKDEIVKVVEFTKIKDCYRLIKYVDGIYSIEYLAESIIINIDEANLYQTPFSNKYFYVANVVSDMPNGERKKHTSAILKEQYENSMLHNLYQPGSTIKVAIATEGPNAGAASIELPGLRTPLENRNELNFSLVNSDLFLVKSIQEDKNNRIENIINALEEEVLEYIDFMGFVEISQRGNLPLVFLTDQINNYCVDLKIKLAKGQLKSEFSNLEIENMMAKVQNRVNSKFKIK